MIVNNLTNHIIIHSSISPLTLLHKEKVTEADGDIGPILGQAQKMSDLDC